MKSQFPQIHLIYNRCKRATPIKKAAVEIRITYNYKQKYISTGIMLLPHQWKNGNITNCEDILQISQILEKQVSDVRKVLYEMMEEGNMDISFISYRLNLLHRRESSFIEFCSQRASVKKYGKEKDTQKRYDRFIRLFSAWGHIKEFEDVTDSMIIQYDEYLKALGMTNYSKWQNYHRFLNSFILDAIDEGLLQRNPYKWVNIDKGKHSDGLDKCLTLSEFKQLKKAKMPTECLERVRDLFVFQTYTCLRYSDLARFDSNNITIINNTHVYKCIQKKTKKIATIPLLKPAMDILDKYKGYLPIISNVKYNLFLKTVAQTAGLEHPLSTHWARHTGATILLNEGIDIKIVSKICGHSSLRITEQIYAKLLDETVVKAVSAVKDKI